MIYKRENPNTPSKRFRSTILNTIGTKIINKFFFKTHQNTVAKHFGKKVCLHRKKTTYKTKFNINYYSYSYKSGIVTNISLGRRYKTSTGLVTYSSGLVNCIPMFNGASLNYIIKT